MSSSRQIPEVARRWGPAVFQTGAVVIYGPILIAQVISAPSVWHWSLVVVWALLAIGLPFTIRSTWRNRHKSLDHGLFPASTIPLTDVDEAVVRDVIMRTDGHGPATRALREAYPGLGLKDARDLVERYR